MARKRGTFTSRTKARKRAADILFEADQKRILDSAPDLLALLEQRREVTAAPSTLAPYSAEIVEGVAGSLPEVDALLQKHAQGAGFSRTPAVDRAVMRVAVWEMLRNQDEVPPIAAIDEAVAIVRQVSTDDSPSYVNAVLDAVRKDIDATRATPHQEATPQALAGGGEAELGAAESDTAGRESSPAASAADTLEEDEDLAALLGEY